MNPSGTLWTHPDPSGPLRDLLDHSKTLLGPLWTLPGALWTALYPSRTPLDPSRTHLDGFPDPSRTLLDASRTPLVPSRTPPDFSGPLQDPSGRVSGRHSPPPLDFFGGYFFNPPEWIRLHPISASLLWPRLNINTPPPLPQPHVVNYTDYSTCYTLIDCISISHTHTHSAVAELRLHRVSNWIPLSRRHVGRDPSLWVSWFDDFIFLRHASFSMQ